MKGFLINTWDVSVFHKDELSLGFVHNGIMHADSKFLREERFPNHHKTQVLNLYARWTLSRIKKSWEGKLRKFGNFSYINFKLKLGGREYQRKIWSFLRKTIINIHEQCCLSPAGTVHRDCAHSSGMSSHAHLGLSLSWWGTFVDQSQAFPSLQKLPNTRGASFSRKLSTDSLCRGLRWLPFLQCWSRILPHCCVCVTIAFPAGSGLDVF